MITYKKRQLLLKVFKKEDRPLLSKALKRLRISHYYRRYLKERIGNYYRELFKRNDSRDQVKTVMRINEIAHISAKYLT